MPIQFIKTTESVKFHSPLQHMEEVEHLIERRKDPLTGRMAIGSPALEGKGPLFFNPTDHELAEKLAADTRENCFFCPEHIESTTPRYREEWIPGGAMRKGDCFLFPNLFPLSAVHAVVALGKQHYRRLGDFPRNLVQDGLEVSLDFLRTLHTNAPENVFFTINSNYLFPAGASIVHPHLQIFGGRYPVTTVVELMDAEDRYRKENGSDYFAELVDEEKKLGERYVCSTGPVHWLTPFAPIGTNELLGIVPACGHFLGLHPGALQGLADGISRVLAYYDHIGFSTFNFSIFSAPVDGSRDSFPVFVRLICRQNVRANYRADDYFIQKLLGEELMLTTPETLAGDLRSFW